MSVSLTDDGTLDTVVRCDECGEEMRFNYDGIQDGPCEHGLMDGCQDCYDAFVDECIEDAKSEHECTRDDEPQEGDLTTSNHKTFYQDGKRVLYQASHYTTSGDWYATVNGREIVLGMFHNDHEAAVRAYMNKTKFWPNVWFISDHGNAHRMDLSEGQA